MLTGKKISLKNVISKIYDGLDLTDDNDHISIIEWLGEAISKIQVYEQLETVHCCLDIHNHKAELPCDLIYLDELTFCGIPLNKGYGNNLSDNYCNEMMLYNQYDYRDARMSGVENIAYELGKRYVHTKGAEFLIQNGWIKTSLECGELDIVYRRLPVDEEGYPLIPEEESFREALFWYVAWKYFFKQRIKASGNDYNKYSQLSAESEQKWHWYCGQAGTTAIMPDVFTLENLKRNFLTLIPKINAYDTNFKNLNKQWHK